MSTSFLSITNDDLHKVTGGGLWGKVGRKVGEVAANGALLLAGLFGPHDPELPSKAPPMGGDPSVTSTTGAPAPRRKPIVKL